MIYFLLCQNLIFPRVARFDIMKEDRPIYGLGAYGSVSPPLMMTTAIAISEYGLSKNLDYWNVSKLQPQLVIRSLAIVICSGPKLKNLFFGELDH